MGSRVGVKQLLVNNNQEADPDAEDIHHRRPPSAAMQAILTLRTQAPATVCMVKLCNRVHGQATARIQPVLLFVRAPHLFCCCTRTHLFCGKGPWPVHLRPPTSARMSVWMGRSQEAKYSSV